jgi:hypothetical protein
LINVEQLIAVEQSSAHQLERNSSFCHAACEHCAYMSPHLYIITFLACIVAKVA